MDGRGLNLHRVAVLAPTSEHLLHDEAKGRIQGAFSEHGVSTVEGRLDKARGHDLWPWEALDFYKAARGGQWQFPEPSFISRNWVSWTSLMRKIQTWNRRLPGGTHTPPGLILGTHETIQGGFSREDVAGILPEHRRVTQRNEFQWGSGFELLSNIRRELKSRSLI